MPKKSKNQDRQYEKVEISLSQAPILSIIFMDKECWKVMSHSPTDSQIKLWRLLQSGEGEFKHLDANTKVKINRGDIEG